MIEIYTEYKLFFFPPPWYRNLSYNSSFVIVPEKNCTTFFWPHDSWWEIHCHFNCFFLLKIRYHFSLTSYKIFFPLSLVFMSLIMMCLNVHFLCLSFLESISFLEYVGLHLTRFGKFPTNIFWSAFELFPLYTLLLRLWLT